MVLLQDLQDTVWIAHLAPWQMGVKQPKYTNADVTSMRRNRFHVWPVNIESDHWALAIYDQFHQHVSWFDSYPTPAGSKALNDFCSSYQQLFLSQYGIQGPNKPSIPSRTPNDLPKQQFSWTCGLHVLENARFFFREPSPSANWKRSVLYSYLQPQGTRRKAAEDYEKAVIYEWINYIRRELGHHESSLELRYPDYPVLPRSQQQKAYWKPNALSLVRNLDPNQISPMLGISRAQPRTLTHPSRP